LRKLAWEQLGRTSNRKEVGGRKKRRRVVLGGNVYEQRYLRERSIDFIEQTGWGGNGDEWKKGEACQSGGNWYKDSTTE